MGLFLHFVHTFESGLELLLLKMLWPLWQLGPAGCTTARRILAFILPVVPGPGLTVIHAVAYVFDLLRVVHQRHLVLQKCRVVSAICCCICCTQLAAWLTGCLPQVHPALCQGRGSSICCSAPLYYMVASLAASSHFFVSISGESNT